ncbi:hypothetical protein BS78_06G066500 [Paspalum vaginatum]|nr:hypothetical protein BS78_06G066500 [Paspalum vaginatum]
MMRRIISRNLGCRREMHIDGDLNFEKKITIKFHLIEIVSGFYFLFSSITCIQYFDAFHPCLACRRPFSLVILHCPISKALVAATPTTLYSQSTSSFSSPPSVATSHPKP